MSLQLKARGFRAFAWCAVVTSTAAALSGCAADAVRSRAPAPLAGDGRGEASEVVFDGVGVQLARAELGARAIDVQRVNWRDPSLSMRKELTPWEKAVWSETPRRSMHRPRRLNLDRRSDTYLYFEQEEQYQFRSQIIHVR